MRVARELALALAAAHALGIVHRDVKPGNVLFDRAGAVQLTDFGIAKLLDQESTQSGALVGTPAYLAPEQLRGASVGPRTDLWALGVNLYHMLTGVRPFDGPSHAATMHAILASQPIPVRRHAPGVPEGLAALVTRLLEKDPAARPGGAAEVAAALWTGAPAAAAWAPTPSAATSASTGRALNTSIVVMPFSTSEPDTYDAALCDGLTEELTAALARTPGLRVTARATADVLRRRELDARAVGNVLGVAHLLEGRVRRHEGRLEVAVRLLRTRDGSLKWSGTFDESLRDYFMLQAELGRAIVGALLPAIESEDTAPVPAPRDPAVQEAYLKGRHFLLKRTPPDLVRAAAYFLDATARDPGFAEAEAGYAETQLFLMLFGTRDPAVGVPATRAALERALASGDLAAVHAAHGNFLFTFEWDWAGGEAALRRALELDPACTDAALYLAQNLQNVGRFEESMAFARGMLQTDPLSPLVNLALGRAYLHANRAGEAVQPLRTALEIAPGFMYAHLQLGHAFLRLARTDDALESLRRAAELNPGHALGHLAHAHALLGERAEAERLLQRLLAMEGTGGFSPIGVATAHAGLGDVDAAFAWLERGERGRVAYMNTLLVTPGFDALRPDARWTALMRRMRFPGAVV
jgi:serine/threonine-protein kinase